MRRLFSICFVILLLMNVMGYYAVFLGVRVQHEGRMEKKLAVESYSNSELVYIRIPIAIPYAHDEADFTPAEGKFEHEGKVYHLVKQRFARDTMTFVCVRDERAGKINTALANYVKSFADNHPQGSKTTVPFSFIKDYIAGFVITSDCFHSLVLQVERTPFEKTFVNSFFREIVHPPERVFAA